MRIQEFVIFEFFMLSVSAVSQLPGSVAFGYLKAQDWSGRSACTDRIPSDAQVSIGRSREQCMWDTERTYLNKE